MKKEPFTNELGMTFAYIPPGTFMMGSPEDEEGRGSDELLHKVTLTRGFHMQTTEVTQGQWKVVMENNPSRFSDQYDTFPVETVSWNDAQAFTEKLNRERGEGPRYRLPTEAEWEYACRAGSTARYYFGDDEDRLWEYACYVRRGGGMTGFVGKKKPNAWGLYDMHGNVAEWCQDWYDLYPPGPATDPAGPSSGMRRILRGGAWCHIATSCRSARRIQKAPGYAKSDVGFRLVMSAE